MAQSGHKGSVKIGVNTVLDVTGFNIDEDAGVIETTSMGAAGLPWRTYIRGLAGATGKIDGNLNLGDTTGQLALFNSLTSDTPLTVDLLTDSGHSIDVDIYITKFSTAVPIDGAQTVSFDFTVTGDVVYGVYP